MTVDNVATTMQQLANACGLGNGYLNEWLNTDDLPYRSISNDVTSQGCCVSNQQDLATINYTKSVPSIGIESSPPKFYNSWSCKKLSDVMKIFGDMPIRSTSMTSDTINSAQQITIECDYYPFQANLPSEGINKSTTKENKKENNKMTNMFDSFNGMFGKLGAGLCRLSMNGGIAVKTNNGYKSYNTKTGRLINCSNFVFDMGDEMFFIIPTNKVEAGDIIMVAGRPRCVIKKDKTTITVINYEDSTIETILPERHIFMGNTYFYGKVVSMFGDDITGGGKKGMNKIMKFMMLSEMMKGGANGNQGNPFGAMMPFMLMNGNMGDLFGGIFDFDDEESDEENEENEDEEPKAEN